jgi:hypothetical protein
MVFSLALSASPLRSFSSRLARVDIALQWRAGVFVGHLLAGHRVSSGTCSPVTGCVGSVTPFQRLTADAALVDDGFDAIAGQHGVAAFDVAEVLEDRLRRQAAAAGAEVPLQVADPEHQFGDGGGARVEFEAEELLRVDGQAFGFEALLAAPESVQLVEHFAFEALHVFERHVEEIRRAAGRVEDANLAQAVVEGVDLGTRGVEPAFVGEQQGRRLDVAPFAAQRLDDGRQDQAFDVGTRRVVGAERVPLAGRQCAFEQGAEDRRFDLRPVGVRGLRAAGRSARDPGR